MAAGRWYPTLTTLGEAPGYNRVLAMTGFLDTLDGCNSVFNRDPEIYNPNLGWSPMEDPQEARQPFDALYPGAHVIPFGARAGKVLYPMPMQQAYVFDPFAPVPPTNGGYWEPVGAPSARERGDGCSVLLPLLPGSTSARVLIVGGGNPPPETAEVMNVTAGTPGWQAAAPMHVPRQHANAVLLPDDTVLMVGGDTSNEATVPVLTAEAYDPATDAWRPLAAMSRPRIYHSTAVLLPDGRVWVAGTFAGTPAGELAGLLIERNIELYSPGYLFEGDRPVITSAPSVVHYGTTFPITTSLPIQTLRLIRLGVTTHSRDMDQRSVGLAFNPTNGSLQVSAPANANVAPPGMYMLFALRPKAASASGQTAIPSVARIVQVKRAS